MAQFVLVDAFWMGPTYLNVENVILVQKAKGTDSTERSAIEQGYTYLVGHNGQLYVREHDARRILVVGGQDLDWRSDERQDALLRPQGTMLKRWPNQGVNASGGQVLENGRRVRRRRVTPVVRRG